MKRMPRREIKAYQMDFAEVASRAKEAELSAREAEADLRRCMLQALRAITSSGEIINLSLKNELPEHLRNLRVIRGDARGSQTFQIFNIRGIDVEPGRLFNSSWTCDAVAVSEKTGKPMNSSLVLRGNFVQVDNFRDEALIEAEARLLAMVTGVLAKMAASAEVSREKELLRQSKSAHLSLKNSPK